MRKLILIMSGVFIVNSGLYACESWFDKFDGAGSLTWQTRAGSFSIDAGRCLANATNNINMHAISTVDNISISDGRVQLKFQTTSAPNMARNAFFVFGYHDNSNYYIIGAREDSDEWVLEEVKKGVKTILASISEPISTGVDYIMNTWISGDSITLTVDGAQKFAYTLNRTPSGKFGMAVENAVTYFDDLSLISWEELPHATTIRFQAKLGDAQEIPIDGALNLIFRLYEKDNGGNPIWEEIHPATSVQNGILDLELGSITPFNLPFDMQYWLGVEIESDGEMTPRFKLSSAPYAFNKIYEKK
ncbi:MAG: hypothetical protein COV72_00460 [Candidatus Omnitrophica bacterium CG11_big_fil_rev_8_21_14_0_20_42_13]|uniref:3-keto-disaccharide hydrolase domain-containing protein n=1 Tax=Candidatus Ghiorseimicrobium undicola TaxID=1974746 RepID=A0A2H0LZW1_9BACT|nr:MAG: hypothetical protein COV72_00460 [Candidatus Omnitrophica bacterium CG11_big_fil_rev_8_21_14_0_20_42_13]